MIFTSRLIKKGILWYLSFGLLLSCSPESTFKFAWLSDTHISESGTAKQDLMAAVTDINSLPDIKFVIISGDVSEYDIGDNLDRAKEILDQLTRPYYIIPGNHDTKWTESGGTKFIKLWGDDKFVFDQAGFKFIGMHQGPEMRMADGHFAPQDLRWLDSILACLKNPAQPIIFITHYPMDSSIDNYSSFLDLIKTYNVKLFLHGHGHRNRVTEYAGIPGVMGRSSLRAQENTGGYTLVEFKKSQFYFYERLPGLQTEVSWASVPIKSETSRIDTTAYSTVADSTYDNNKNFLIEWRFDSGFTSTASPVLMRGLILWGDASGTFYALDAQNGQEKWHFKTKGRIYASAATEGEITLFSSTDSCIYALNSRTGDLMWKYKTDAPVLAVPLISDNLVYVGSSDHKFRALSLQTGKILWVYEEVQGFIENKPLCYNQLIIFSAWDETVYALDKLSGRLLWKWKDGRSNRLYSPAACWPVAANDKIYIVAPDRFMTAIESKTGKTLWRSSQFKVRETIGLSQDQKRIYARTMRDTIFAISTCSAEYEVLWSANFQFGYDIASSMITESSGTAYIVTKNGLIIAVAGNNGQEQWRYKFENSLINTILAIDKRKIVFSTMDGKVVSLLPKRAD